MIEKDELIVEGILHGNVAQYEILVKKYQNKVYQLIFRMTNSREDSLDLTQETFLQAYRSLPQFNRQSSFYTWLYKVASNKTLDFLRKKKRRSDGDERLLSQSLIEAAVSKNKESPEGLFIQKEQSSALKRVISSMPEKYRLVIILNHYNGLSYREIAEVLGLPEKTVATRIYRARLLLREKLMKGGEKNELP